MLIAHEPMREIAHERDDPLASGSGRRQAAPEAVVEVEVVEDFEVEAAMAEGRGGRRALRGRARGSASASASYARGVAARGAATP